MSTKFQRTWQKHTAGQVLFTVALDAEGEDLTIERHRRLADMTRWLVELFSAHRLPATWAAGNPAQCAATRPVMRSTIPHEMALLGNATWTGPATDRSEFVRELNRRLGLARSAGLTVTSLVPQSESIRHYVDVAIKQGISAVASWADQQTRNAQPANPRALHYGLWDLPVTDQLPLRSSWLPGRTGSFLRRIRTAADQSSTVHVIITAKALEQATPRSEASISRVVRGVTELRDRGLVRVETLSTAAAKLSDVPSAMPQRSILRRVA